MSSHSQLSGPLSLPASASNRRARWSCSWWSRLLVGGLMLLAGGCADLEPMEDPDVTDFQLTIDTMRAAAREAERNLADLRLELDSQRQELSSALIARAQLEGRLREVERRLADSRHIIELQREELATMRMERERSSKSEPSPIPKLKQSRKRPAPADRPAIGQVVPNVPSPPVPPVVSQPSQDTAPVPPSTLSPEPESLPVAPPVAPVPPVSQLNGGTAAVAQRQENGLDAGSFVRSTAVQAGDTLWRLARRYGVEVDALRSLNGLSGDLIQVGQALIIPAAGAR